MFGLCDIFFLYFIVHLEGFADTKGNKKEKKQRNEPKKNGR